MSKFKSLEELFAGRHFDHMVREYTNVRAAQFRSGADGQRPGTAELRVGGPRSAHKTHRDKLGHSTGRR
jgi:hypothetical protein